jgi:hypothetical protein
MSLQKTSILMIEGCTIERRADTMQNHRRMNDAPKNREPGYARPALPCLPGWLKVQGMPALVAKATG